MSTTVIDPANIEGYSASSGSITLGGSLSLATGPDKVLFLPFVADSALLTLGAFTGGGAASTSPPGFVYDLSTIDDGIVTGTVILTTGGASVVVPLSVLVSSLPSLNISWGFPSASDSSDGATGAGGPWLSPGAVYVGLLAAYNGLTGDVTDAAGTAVDFAFTTGPTPTAPNTTGIITTNDKGSFASCYPDTGTDAASKIDSSAGAVLVWVRLAGQAWRDVGALGVG